MSRGALRPYFFAFFLLFGLLLLLGGNAAARDTEAGVSGRVLWVHDGDTIKVAGVGTIRLIGIDTPERQESERDRQFVKRGISSQHLRPTAAEALDFNIRSVKGKVVRLVFDSETKDRHGRTLAYVYLPDGRLLNRLLIEKGYAVVYRRFDFRLKDDFLAAEADARRRRVGLWVQP
jgi:micrococcal nuclease